MCLYLLRRCRSICDCQYFDSTALQRIDLVGVLLRSQLQSDNRQPSCYPLGPLPPHLQALPRAGSSLQPSGRAHSRRQPPRQCQHSPATAQRRCGCPRLTRWLPRRWGAPACTTYAARSNLTRGVSAGNEMQTNCAKKGRGE